MRNTAEQKYRSPEELRQDLLRVIAKMNGVYPTFTLAIVCYAATWIMELTEAERSHFIHYAQNLDSMHYLDPTGEDLEIVLKAGRNAHKATGRDISNDQSMKAVAVSMFAVSSRIAKDFLLGIAEADIPKVVHQIRGILDNPQYKADFRNNFRDFTKRGKLEYAITDELKKVFDTYGIKIPFYQI